MKHLIYFSIKVSQFLFIRTGLLILRIKLKVNNNKNSHIH